MKKTKATAEGYRLAQAQEMINSVGNCVELPLDSNGKLVPTVKTLQAIIKQLRASKRAEAIVTKRQG